LTPIYLINPDKQNYGRTITLNAAVKSVNLKEVMARPKFPTQKAQKRDQEIKIRI
jgi:hypothetical protein